jgi:hypothetical protein
LERRVSVEQAILGLGGPARGTSRQILAGCLQATDCVTPEMQAFKQHLASNAEALRNRSPVEYHSESRVCDTDVYLADEGVQIVDQDSVDVRELMRRVEGMPNAPDADLNLNEARRRLDFIDPWWIALRNLPKDRYITS